jgi:hypothetical protein
MVAALFSALRGFKGIFGRNGAPYKSSHHNSSDQKEYIIWHRIYAVIRSTDPATAGLPSLA